MSTDQVQDDKVNEQVARRWIEDHSTEAAQAVLDARGMRYVGYRNPGGDRILTGGPPEPADEWLYVVDWPDA